MEEEKKDALTMNIDWSKELAAIGIHLESLEEKLAREEKERKRKQKLPHVDKGQCLFL